MFRGPGAFGPEERYGLHAEGKQHVKGATDVVHEGNS
jgi:hypothetical protein